MLPSDERIHRLVNAAREARRYLRNVATGNGRSGPHDGIVIGRTLTSVLELFDDIEPYHDEDRREWNARRADVPADVQARR